MRNWTYVKWLLPNVEALDRTVTALAESPDFALRRHDQPWFFLRYVDFYGPQLRLRVLAEPGQRLPLVEWARNWYLEQITELEEAGLGSPGGPVPGRMGFDVAPYRPETTKYGSIACVERVEDLWTRQCPQVLDLWSPPHTKSARIAVYTTVALEVMEGLGLAGDNGSAFRTHAWYWLRSMNPSQQVAQRFIGQVRHAVVGPQGGTRRTSPGTFSTDLLVAIQDLVDLPDSRAMAHYAFNLLHILANRLGLAPIEEGLVMMALAETVAERAPVGAVS